MRDYWMTPDDPARTAGPGELESDRRSYHDDDVDADLLAPSCIASIALTLPESPRTVDILVALRRAYDEGWVSGRKDRADHAKLLDTTLAMIGKALER